MKEGAVGVANVDDDRKAFGKFKQGVAKLQGDSLVKPRQDQAGFFGLECRDVQIASFHEEFAVLGRAVGAIRQGVSLDCPDAAQDHGLDLLLDLAPLPVGQGFAAIQGFDLVAEIGVVLRGGP